MAATWKKNYSRYRSFIVSNLSHYRQRNDLRAYLELFLSLATIAIFSVFALRPTLITIAKLVNEIDVNQETIDTMNIKITNLKKAQSLYNQHKNNIDILNSSIPSDPQPDIFVRQVEGIADQAEVVTTSMSLDEAPLLSSTTIGQKEDSNFPEGINEYNYNIHAVSNYPQLFNLLQLFETIRRLSVIKSVNIQPIKTDLGELIGISINGKVPFIPDATIIDFEGGKTP
jgi:hypothetical protein